jgi:hypothetical protein
MVTASECSIEVNSDNTVVDLHPKYLHETF